MFCYQLFNPSNNLQPYFIVLGSSFGSSHYIKYYYNNLMFSLCLYLIICLIFLLYTLFQLVVSWHNSQQYNNSFDTAFLFSFFDRTIRNIITPTKIPTGLVFYFKQTNFNNFVLLSSSLIEYLSYPHLLSFSKLY